MKKEKGMSFAGKSCARIVCIVLLTLSIMQAFLFCIMMDFGVYGATLSQMQEYYIERSAHEMSTLILGQYMEYDKTTARKNLPDWDEESVNFVIYKDGEIYDTIQNVSQEQVNRVGWLYQFEYSGEEVLAYYGWYVDEVYTEAQKEKAKQFMIQATVVYSYEWGNRVGNILQTTSTLYDLRYEILVTFSVTFVGALILLITLTKKAGLIKGREELRVSFWDKIPFDVMLFAYFWVALGIVWCVDVTYYAYHRVIDYTGIDLWLFGSITAALFAGVTACLLLLLLETLSVRLKQGQIWKNTIIYKLLHWLFMRGKQGTGFLRRSMGTLGRNLPFIWKGTLIYVGIAFLEFLGILLAYAEYEFGILAVLWALEKVVLLAAFVIVLIQMKKLQESGERLAAGDLTHKTETSRLLFDFKQHGENLNQIGVGIQKAVAERMKSEHFKTELITNVSHDIKTPLTSIINYVDLLEKEDLQNENAREYLEVLHRQSARLKKLIEDLMEASKASTGALVVNYEDCEVGVMLAQSAGEFEEKLQSCDLEFLIQKPEEEVVISADGRHLWRIFDNLMNNIYKYAQPGTRVYLNLEKKEQFVEIIFRNTSKYALNISSEELMERFVRGDSSRNTEGSGLGLSIARSLTELMGGKFDLVIDGDLFKVILVFPYR